MLLLISRRNFSEFRHHTLKSGVFDFFGRAVALPLTRSILVGRSYRVETPLFYLSPQVFRVNHVLLVPKFSLGVLPQKALKKPTT